MKVKKFKERKDKTKNRQTLRQACYQYIIDHAYPSPKGMMVSFYLPQKDEFFRKLEAREYMDYIRVAKDDGWEGYGAWLIEYQKIKKAHDANKCYRRRYEKLRKNGGRWVKIMMWVNAKINKQIKKHL